MDIGHLINNTTLFIFFHIFNELKNTRRLVFFLILFLRGMPRIQTNYAMGDVPQCVNSSPKIKNVT